MAAHFSEIKERGIVYAWDGEVVGLRAEIERLRAAIETIGRIVEGFDYNHGAEIKRIIHSLKD
jgi:hypothetical protein